MLLFRATACHLVIWWSKHQIVWIPFAKHRIRIGTLLRVIFATIFRIIPTFAKWRLVAVLPGAAKKCSRAAAHLYLVFVAAFSRVHGTIAGRRKLLTIRSFQTVTNPGNFILAHVKITHLFVLNHLQGSLYNSPMADIQASRYGGVGSPFRAFSSPENKLDKVYTQ